MYSSSRAVQTAVVVGRPQLVVLRYTAVEFYLRVYMYVLPAVYSSRIYSSRITRVRADVLMNAGLGAGGRAGGRAPFL